MSITPTTPTMPTRPTTPQKTTTLIKPARESSAPPWLLGPLDHPNFLLNLRGTWLFRAKLDPLHLQRGLSEVLSFYPHLAGRMLRGETVVCDNAGLPFTVASRPDLHLDDALTGRASADLFAEKLNRRLVKQGRQAPMAIRLTHLADGSVVSVVCTHAILDGRSFYTFVSRWGAACAGGSYAPPIVDQTLLPAFPPSSKDDLFRRVRAAGWQPLSFWTILKLLPKMLFGRLLERTPPFYLSPASLQKLKDEVASAFTTFVSPDIPPLQDASQGVQGAVASAFPTSVASDAPTLQRTLESPEGRTFRTYDILVAYLSKMTASLFGLPAGTPCGQALVMDMRERIASLPPGFAGNGALVVAGAEFPAGASLAEIAARTHERTAPFLETPSPSMEAQLRLGLEILHHRALWLPYDIGRVHCRRPTVFYINHFLKMPIYEVNFGTKETPAFPIRVIPHDLPDPLLLWPAPPEVGGIEIYWTGIAARAVKRQPQDGPWWEEIRPYLSLAPEPSTPISTLAPPTPTKGA